MPSSITAEATTAVESVNVAFTVDLEGWQNGSDQRLATLHEPHRPTPSRVRCIAWFAAYGQSPET
jgi:hypothetical protein